MSRGSATTAAQAGEATEKLVTGLAVATVFAFAVTLAARGLAHRGRWDLNEAIATADRLATVGPMYSVGDVDGFLPSTPYFPGVTWLALAVRSIAGLRWQEEILLGLASAVAVAYLLLLMKIFVTLGGKSRMAVAAIASVSVVLWSGRNWTMYAVEFKPDSASLIAFTIAFVLTFTQRLSIAASVGVFTACAAGLFMKQQAAMLALGLLVSVLVSNQVARERLVRVATIAVASVFAVVTMLCIDGLEYSAIQAHRGRAILPFGEILASQGRLAIELLVAALVFAVGLRRGATRRQAIQSLTKHGLVRAYAIMILPWIIFSVFASVAYGGNAGNTEVALLPALPLLLVALESAYGVKAFAVSALTLAPACIVFLTITAIGHLRDIPDYYAARTLALRELAPFAGADVAISDDSYIVARMAGLNVRTSLNTVMHIENGMFQGAGVPQINARLRRREYRLIMCMPSCGNIAWKRVEFSPHYVATSAFASPLLQGAVLIPTPITR